MHEKFNENKTSTAFMAVQAALVGLLGALMASAYCILFDIAQRGTQKIALFAQKNIWACLGWFAFLFVAAIAVYFIRKWEPMISGGGIPMIESELHGKSFHKPWKIIFARYIGGMITAFCGLSLGRAGPSAQISAMTGLGASKLFKHDETEKKILLACGAGAGFAAAFHAPMAGFFFAFEVLRRCVPHDGVLPCLCATATAGLAAKYIFKGTKIFEISAAETITPNAYLSFIILGVVLGLFGAFYNKFSAHLPKIYSVIKKDSHKIIFAFLMSGVFALFLPQILGSGQAMTNMISLGKNSVGMLFVMLICKFIFSMICTGSGAPGGIFMPLFGMSSAIGAIMFAFATAQMGVSPQLLHSFVGLAIVGGFAAVARAPITGIALLLETTGDFWSMPSAITVCVIAYIISELLHKPSIGEQQLNKLHGNLPKKAVDTADFVGVK